MESLRYEAGDRLVPYSEHSVRIIRDALCRELRVLLDTDHAAVDIAHVEFFATMSQKESAHTPIAQSLITCRYHGHSIQLPLSQGFFRPAPGRRKPH